MTEFDTHEKEALANSDTLVAAGVGADMEFTGDGGIEKYNKSFTESCGDIEKTTQGFVASIEADAEA